MESITVFSAGSFQYALQELSDIFRQIHHVEIKAFCGPAGILRQQIEQGAKCDIFISANSENVFQLGDSKTIYQKLTIAFNQLALTTLNLEHFRHKSIFELLVDRSLRLATSTPSCDPCGDYTWLLFDKIEQCFPGEGEALKRRALKLVGGTSSNIIPKGKIASHYLLSNGYADMMIGYSHYQVRSEFDLSKSYSSMDTDFNIGITNQAFLTHIFPVEFEVKAEYVVALLNNVESAVKFFEFLCSNKAKDIIKNHGFLLE
ncbi:substrate-binding domain-containing protein [Haemophilus haemolyticus]|uniref:substrate-binding domain-containing protein n=1 Tax=Haemophilus haemolyticus TaxID=726 RepID=UPI00025E65FF|nr:substrate-binding domain-containing protein [Haemophilus haemolyticus]EIJ74378.1 molybdate ABC transporter, periplasmic molybdate-binding family protein [Haemophilus haemolyticus HK386]OBX39299.1 molybdenum ABC transporter substrate-binding protein [Haemophilus haemolyticus]